MFFCQIAFSQKLDSTLMNRSLDITFRMNNLLNLDKFQQDSITKITYSLFTQSKNVYLNNFSKDSLRISLQRVESTRDIYYYTVLDSNQFLEYKKNKIFILFGVND